MSVMISRGIFELDLGTTNDSVGARQASACIDRDHSHIGLPTHLSMMTQQVRKTQCSSVALQLFQS